MTRPPRTRKPPTHRRPKRGTSMLQGRDLPGRLSKDMLLDSGVLHAVNEHYAYLTAFSDSLYGRANILSDVMPQTAIACMTTAAWVWCGGVFPTSFDVVSTSHFRKFMMNRPVRTYARHIEPGHIQRIGELQLTSPPRTACDLALLPAHMLFEDGWDAIVHKLMGDYGVTVDECAALLAERRFPPQAKQARQAYQFFGLPVPEYLLEADEEPEPLLP